MTINAENPTRYRRPMGDGSYSGIDSTVAVAGWVGDGKRDGK